MMEVFCAGINVDDASLFRPVPGSIVDDLGLWNASPCGSVSEHDSGSPSAGEAIRAEPLPTEARPYLLTAMCKGAKDWPK